MAFNNSGATLYSTGQPDKTYSLEDFIDMQSSDDITYYNYSILEYLNGFDMFVTNLLYDYDDEINDSIVTVTLTDKEKIKYRYKPYLLAYDVYGSTEAEFIFMMLNGIIDPKEFDFTKIKALRKSDLNNILSRLQAINDQYINNNRSVLQEAFKNSDGNDIWGE